VTDLTSPSESAAHRLEGRQLEGWQVGKRRQLGPDQSGSVNSVGYFVKHASGQEGFLKALDYSAAFDREDPARELQSMTESFNAERDLLEWCGQTGLHRIVRALASGTARVPNTNPSVVDYLILELAPGGDARAAVSSRDPGDQVPMIWLAHEATAAMAQLHNKRIMHQDVKPSNFLVWDDTPIPSGKLGDVGSAFVESRPVGHDEKIIAGDATYAAPELLYGCPFRNSQSWRRQAGDIFMLGNLITYLVVTVPYSGIFACNLDRTQDRLRWKGTFDEILPALVDAHGLTMACIRTALHGDFADSVASVIDELCYPDPELRGDPIARRRGSNPYDLTRYISRLDLAHKKAKLHRRLP
jgi:serine/threonine protein kinase